MRQVAGGARVSTVVTSVISEDVQGRETCCQVVEEEMTTLGLARA